jgi:hypothetical protein
MQDETCQVEDKAVELVVVALANTSAEPDTVVVELEDAVVANVAVGASWGTKDVASFAKLLLKKVRRIGIQHLGVLHTRCFRDIYVFVWQIAACYVPRPTRHNPWVCRGSSDQLH